MYIKRFIPIFPIPFYSVTYRLIFKPRKVRREEGRKAGGKEGRGRAGGGKEGRKEGRTDEREANKRKTG
jgi:hypothetical protein